MITINALTFVFLVVLIFWWHLVPWLLRFGLLRLLPAILGRIVEEVRAKSGNSG